MAVDRGGRDDKRQRRAFQRLAADAIGTLNLLEGFGINFDGDTINVALNPTDPGLSLTGGLGILLGTNPGLTTTGGLAIQVASGAPFSLTSGLDLVLATNSGLDVVADQLTVVLGSDPALSLTASGLIVSLATGAPLDTVGGLDVVLAADGGIENDTAALRIKLPTDPDFFTDADGLHNLYPDSRHEEITFALPPPAYRASPGELVILDSTTGAATQGVFLPDATTCPGEHVTIKLTGNRSVQLAIATENGDRIEGVPVVGGVSLILVFVPDVGYRCTSDGTDWWVTSAYEAPGAFAWQRYVVDYTDLAVAALTDTQQLFSGGVGAAYTRVIEAAFYHITQQFAGPGITDVKISVGQTSNKTLVHPSADVDVVANTRTAFNEVNHVGTNVFTINAYATAVGANLNQLTAGRVTIYVKWGLVGPAL